MTTYTASVNIQQLILSVMHKVFMEIPVKKDNCGINMSYNFIGKYIGYDAKRLRSAHKEMAPHSSFETYVQTITLHELGHAMDQEALDASLTKTMEIFTMKKGHSLREIFHTPKLFKMLIEEHEMNIRFEETAWENAALLNARYHLVDPEQFETIRKNSLATYHQLYLEDLELYEKLVGIPTIDPVA